MNGCKFAILDEYAPLRFPSDSNTSTNPSRNTSFAFSLKSSGNHLIASKNNSRDSSYEYFLSDLARVKNLSYVWYFSKPNISFLNLIPNILDVLLIL